MQTIHSLSICEWKKSYARALACIAKAGEKGISKKELLSRMLEDFGKTCHDNTIDVILNNLLLVGFIVQIENSELWICTAKGFKE